MQTLISLLHALPWFAWIAIVAILSGAFSGIVKMIVVHRERMAMIYQGLNPDTLTLKPYMEDQEVA